MPPTPGYEKSKHSGLGGVFKSLTNSFKQTGGRVPVTINAKVVGGGSDMPRLLYELRNETLPVRVEAANEICKLIEKISISSTTEIWYLARDLCGKDRASAARRSGLKVLIECIKKHSDSTGDKLVYYRDIIGLCDTSNGRLDPEFDLFLEALIQLTDNGKDLHDLNVYNLEQTWSDFILRSFDLSCKSALSFDKPESLRTKEYVCFVKLVKYINSCLKFSFADVNDQFVMRVLNTVIAVCSVTEDIPVVTELSLVVNTVTVFGHVPSQSRFSIVKLLCWLSYLSSDSQELSSESLLKLFTESPSDVLLDIVTILQDPILQEARSRDFKEEELHMIPKNIKKSIITALGAISSLEHLLLNLSTGEHAHKEILPLKRVYVMVTSAQVCEISLLNSGILRLFDRLFSQSTRGNTRDECTPFSIMFPFHIWCLTSENLFDLLLRLHLKSVQEQESWTSICLSLLSKYDSNQISVTSDRLVSFFLRKPHCLPESIAFFVLKHFQDSKACVCFNTSWKENCGTLFNAFYYSDNPGSISTTIRIKTLEILYLAFEYSVAFYEDYSIGRDYLLCAIQNVKIESDPELIEYLYHELMFNIITTSSLEFYKELLSVFDAQLYSRPMKSGLKSYVSLNSFPSNTPKRIRSIKSDRESEANIVATKQGYPSELAKVLCKSFLTLSLSKPEETSLLFEFMINFCQTSLADEDYDVCLILVRSLVRIRCSVEGYVYFCQPADMEGLATTMNRNTLIEAYKPLPSHKWCYPEEKAYLPVSTLNQPNRNLKIFNPTSSKLNIGRAGSATLDVSKWFAIVTKITEEHYNWELYSFIWAHFCSQLCNVSLFEGNNVFISRFRKTVCDQLSLSLPPTLTFPLPDPNVTKADLLVAFIRTLSSLMGYHNFFNKQEEDHIISSLLSSLASWEKTAIPSIHMLTICCYEIPQSMKKYLIPILTRLQTSITSAFASSHTLEFLMALIQVPTLTSNFTIDEFKRVFAIAFRYIEHAMDMKKRKGLLKKPDDLESVRLQSHGVDAEVDNKVSTLTKSTPMLHQYLLTTSFEVLSQWFLKMKLEDRLQVSSFIMRKIVSCCGAEKFQDFDDVTIAHLDFVARFTYSNLPLKIITPKKPTYQANLSCNKWIIGQSIVSIDVDIQSGDSVIALRRPTGFAVFELKLHPDMITHTFKSKEIQPLFTSSYLLLQLFKPLDQESISKPIPLLEDSTTERAVSTFDRVPVVAHHKAGIIYIGPGQKEEAEILANTVGSADYQNFLEGIGQMIKLNKADSVYVGGLDKENGTDGEFAYFWSDELTQLIFHTTTLMPTTHNDKYLLLKKRHIGNNHVNVFFNESELPFNFNVIRSQFNFINIVISPHTICCEPAGRNGCKYYKVKTYRRSEVPGIFSTSHYKLISLEQLPQFIRNSVLMASRFARIWHESIDGVYVTNWELRVKQLRALRERAYTAHKALYDEKQKHSEEQDVAKNSGGGTDLASTNMIQSFLEQLQAPNSSSFANNLLQGARYEHPSPSDNELHNLLEFNSYTC